MSLATPAPLRIAVVEDDTATRERIAQVFSGDGRFLVASLAATAREAIRFLDGDSADVLLVDLGLPDLHGTEVIRRAVARWPGCDIMVITMFGDESNVIESIEAGATGYVLKDVGDKALVDAVLQLRAGGAPMTPGIARLVLSRIRSSTAPSPAADPGSSLTVRETDVLNCLSRGYSYAETADRLGISLHTVTSHIKNTYRKLCVHSGLAAVKRAQELGLLNDGKPKRR